MGLTPNFALPYPELGDAPNGAGQIQALAAAVDTALLNQQTTVEQQISEVSGSTWAWTVGNATLEGGRPYILDPAALSVPLPNPNGVYEIEVLADYATPAKTVTVAGAQVTLPAGATANIQTGYLNASGQWVESPSWLANQASYHLGTPASEFEEYTTLIKGMVWCHGDAGNFSLTLTTSNGGTAVTGLQVYDGTYVKVTPMSLPAS